MYEVDQRAWWWGLWGLAAAAVLTGHGRARGGGEVHGAAHRVSCVRAAMLFRSATHPTRQLSPELLTLPRQLILPSRLLIGWRTWREVFLVSVLIGREDQSKVRPRPVDFAEEN